MEEFIDDTIKKGEQRKQFHQIIYDLKQEFQSISKINQMSKESDENFKKQDQIYSFQDFNNKNINSNNDICPMDQQSEKNVQDLERKQFNNNDQKMAISMFSPQDLSLTKNQQMINYSMDSSFRGDNFYQNDQNQLSRSRNNSFIELSNNSNITQAKDLQKQDQSNEQNTKIKQFNHRFEEGYTLYKQSPLNLYLKNNPKLFEQQIIIKKIQQIQKREYREWNRDYFNQINLGKLNQQFVNCQDQIIKTLEEKNFYLCDYLTKGGEGFIFEGYKKMSFGQYQDYIFKILFDCNENNINEEIKIMNIFEKNINVIKAQDFIKIDNINAFIIVLQKCKYSLKDELEKNQKNKIQFTQEKLLKIIFDLLDGLIQMRIYNILHIDIKPANILVSESGDYLYTDFGVSLFYNKDNIFEVKGYTEKFAPIEVILNQPQDINFKSDVYSLGMTFNQILAQFKPKDSKEIEMIAQFKNIIKNNMLQEKQIERKECLEIHSLFLQVSLNVKNLSFLENYSNKLNSILALYEYDNNKDIPYFLDLCLYYELKQIDILQLLSMNIQKLLKAIENVAERYLSLSKFKQALNFSKYSLELGQKQVNEIHYDISNSHLLVGKSYRHNGDQKNAINHLKQSLEMRRQLFKENHLGIAICLKEIAECYYDNRDFRSAYLYTLESLEMQKQLFKGNHSDIAENLRNLYVLFGEFQDVYISEQYLEESLEMIQELYQGYHPEIAQILIDKAQTYLNQYDTKNCRKYLDKFDQISQKLFHENHQQIIDYLYIYGEYYFQKWDFQNSLKKSLKSLELKKNLYSQSSPELECSIQQIGIIYTQMGKYKEAEKYLLQSQETFKQIYQENPYLLADCLYNIGNLYYQCGQYNKALKYELECLELRQLHLKQQNNHDLAISLRSIGQIYLKLDLFKEAKLYFFNSLKMFLSLYQERHHQIANCFFDIGIYYKRLRNNQNYLIYYFKGIEMKIKLYYGEEHVEIIEKQIEISNFYLEYNQHQNSLNYLIDCHEKYPNNLKIIKKLKDQYYETPINDYHNSIKYGFLYIEKSKQNSNQNIDIDNIFQHIGWCYYKLDLISNAIEYTIKSLEKDQKNENDKLQTAEKLFNIGFYYYKAGDKYNALKYSLESIQIRKKIQILEQFEKVSYFKLDKNYETQNYLLECLKTRKQLSLKNDFLIIDCLIHIRYCYKSNNDYKNSLKYLLQARRYNFESHFEYCEIAVIYIYLGHFKKSIMFLIKYLQSQQEDNYLLINKIINIYYIDLKEYENGIEFGLKYIKIFSQNLKINMNYINELSFNIGCCYQKIYNFQKSLKYFINSLELIKYQINQIELDDINEETLKRYILICKQYYKLGDYQMALLYSLELFDINRQFCQEEDKGYDYFEEEIKFNDVIPIVLNCYFIFYDIQTAFNYSLKFIKHDLCQNQESNDYVIQKFQKFINIDKDFQKLQISKDLLLDLISSKGLEFD